MARLSRLLKVGSMTESLGVYVPAMGAQKAIGLGRTLLLAWLLHEAEYGLWGVAMMVFVLAGGLINLGTKHGLIRYVSAHESRGQIAAFYRLMRLRVSAVVLAALAIALAASGPLTRHVIASRSLAAGRYEQLLPVCWAALANAGAMALYHSTLAFAGGLRMYRLAALMELGFSVLFTVFGIAAAGTAHTALAVLLAHLAAIMVTLAAGLCLLHAGVAEVSRARPIDSRGLEGAFARVVRFGLAAMVGVLLWTTVPYVGFQMANRQFNKATVAAFALMMQLSQPILFLATASWTVIFSHVARRWEGGDRPGAQAMLETAYKAIALVTMTLTILLYAASPLWVRLLPGKYHGGKDLLGGLLLLFQVIGQLSLVSMLARLREKPIIISLSAFSAGAAAALLVGRWMDHSGLPGAALASGVGAYLGGGVVAGAYFLLGRIRLGIGTWVVLACPILLVLPAWAAAAGWAAVLMLATATGLLFGPREKAQLLEKLKSLPRPGRN